MKNPIYLTDQELLRGINLMRKNARLLENIEKKTATHLSQQEQDIVHFLFLNPDCSAQTVAKKVQIPQQSLSRSIRKLVAIDYINIAPDDDDRRVKRLRLSTKGQKNYKTQQQYIMKSFYQAYQHSGIESVLGFINVHSALLSALGKANSENRQK